jgi:hypothetical protein
VSVHYCTFNCAVGVRWLCISISRVGGVKQNQTERGREKEELKIFKEGLS